MRRSLFPVLVLILATACSSARTSRPANIAPPDITTEAVGGLFFGSGRTAPITLEVTITNNATTPITVRQLDVSAPGMTTFTIRPVRRLIREEIAAGETRAVPLYTQAITNVRNPSEPLTLRTTVYFEANGSRWIEIVQR